MSKPSFHLPDVPSETSVETLVRRLREDSAKKQISPKNYAHRLRVIRQQTELLGRQSAASHDSGPRVAIKRPVPQEAPSA